MAGQSSSRPRPTFGIDWPADVEPLLSPKDEAAPTLVEAGDQGRLPRYDDCRRHYATLRNAPARPTPPPPTPR